jgi:tryptophan halogenase
MVVPESLQQKMELFKHRGHIETYKYGLFAPPSWISVFLGQGMAQGGIDPYAQQLPLDKVKDKLQELSVSIKRRVQLMPTHEEFISDYCPFKL